MAETVFKFMTPNAEMETSHRIRMRRKEKYELPPEHERRLLAIWISAHHKEPNLRFIFSQILNAFDTSHMIKQKHTCDEVCLDFAA